MQAKIVRHGQHSSKSPTKHTCWSPCSANAIAQDEQRSEGTPVGQSLPTPCLHRFGRLLVSSVTKANMSSSTVLSLFLAFALVANFSVYVAVFWKRFTTVKNFAVVQRTVQCTVVDRP